MTATPGDFDQVGLLVYTNSAGTFTASVDQPWMHFSPATGFTGAGIAAGSFITLDADAADLTSGTYQGKLTINSTAGTATVPVTFKVGAPSTLTLTPSTMTFQYALGSQSYPAGQSSILTVSGAADGTPLTANSLSPWILVNGKTSATGSVGSNLTISVDAAGLGSSPAADTYVGFVYVNGGGMSGILKVSLTVTGTGSGGADSLTFYVPTVGGTAAPQYLTINGNGPYVAVAAPNSGNSQWLSVSPSAGTLDTSPVLKVSVSSAGLLAGAYSGTIRISSGSVLLQTVPVTLYVASANASPHLAAAPLNLTFSLPPGASQSQSVILSGGGGAYNAQALGKGISVSPVNGTTPAVLTVSVDASVFSAGEITVGYVVIQSNSGSQLITATIKVLAGTLIQTNPAALAFMVGNGNLPVTNIQVSGLGESSQSFTVTGPSFVNLASNSLTTPASIAIAINTNALGSGLNTGNIVINAPGAANSPLKIPVTVLASGSNTSSLAVTPSQLTLTGVTGGAAIKNSVSIGGFAGAPFTAAASSTGSWLSVTPAAATSPSTVTVTANPLNLGPGTYAGTVTFTTDNGFVAVLTVELAVSDVTKVLPILSLSSSQLNFTSRLGDPAPPEQTVQIGASGVAVKFTVTASANWITVSQVSGATPAALRVGVIPGGLFNGEYTGTVTVSCPDAANSPQTIGVTMSIALRPALSVDRNAVNFTWFTGSAAPAAESVKVTSTAADLPFTVSTANAPWLAVTPASGATPATLTLKVNSAGMVPGTYPASLTIDGGISTKTISLQLTVTPPLPTVAAVYNAASLRSSAIAPGEIITIEGSEIGPATLVKMAANADVVDTSLSGTRVLVGGFPAPVLYTSSTQVSAVVPYEIAGRSSTFVQVEYLQQKSNALTIPVAASSPGVFKETIFNNDGSANAPDNPAEAGNTIIVYATGEGQTLPAGVNGKIANDAGELPKPTLPVSVKIDGVPAQVAYAGAVQGAVAGLLQVNILVPAGAKSGDLILTIGNSSSQSGMSVAIR